MKPLQPINCDGCGKPIDDVNMGMILYSSAKRNIRAVHKVTCDPDASGDYWEELSMLPMPDVIPHRGA